jgi:hypothetical protein
VKKGTKDRHMRRRKLLYIMMNKKAQKVHPKVDLRIVEVGGRADEAEGTTCYGRTGGEIGG